MANINPFYLIISLIITIPLYYVIPIILCVKRAKKLNQSKIVWGILGFFLSYVAVLIAYILPVENTENKDYKMKFLFEKFTSKRLFFVSLAVVVYLAFIFINGTIIKSKFIYNVSLQELFALPLIFIVQPGLLILSFLYCIKEKFCIKKFSFWTFILLLISNLLFLGSFIIPRH